MLDITMEFKKGILFVRLKGILNGDTCTILDDNITNLIADNGIKYVLLNLNNITYIDHYGTDIILKNYLNVACNRGKFIIVGITKIFNYNVLVIDNLYQINDENGAFSLVNI